MGGWGPFKKKKKTRNPKNVYWLIGNIFSKMDGWMACASVT